MRRLLVAILLMAATACGKKGPPLLPFVRQPKAADITSARRVGNDVYLTIAVPTANVDDSMPASLATIEVWGVTATTPPTQLQFTTVGAIVTKIPVARYPDPSDNSGTIIPDSRTGALQGTLVTIQESLTPEKKVAREAPSAKAPVGKPASVASPETPQAEAAGPRVLRRFYMTIPVSARPRAGRPSAIVEVPMTMMPDKVPNVRVKMQNHDVVLEWEPPGGLLGWLVDRAMAPEAPPVEERPTSTASLPAVPSGPTLYDVYRDTAPDPLELPQRGATGTPSASSQATPITAQPQQGLSFREDVPFDGRERCYYVRAVRGSGAQRIDGEASDRKCIVPVDIEAPAMPTGLMATAVEGSIGLRWEPNGEEDLAGYIVLRGEAGSDTLQLLTTSPIARTTFTDPTAVAGQMYRYVVQAVDNRIPLPNVSEPAEIAVTAR